MNSTDIHFYTSLVLRRLPYLSGMFIVAVIASVVLALAMPRVYRSTAKILVEAPQIPADMVRSTIATSPLQQLQIIQQQITTRATLAELATHIGIHQETTP